MFRIPLPWLKGIKRRTIEHDYGYYDGPDVIWDKIHGPPWEYGTRPNFYETRDKAFMSLAYLSVCRVSELCRANLKAGYKPSIKKDQFHFEEDVISLREVIVLKRREIVDGKWSHIQDLSHYPIRREIHLPLKGGLSKFTELIVDYLDMLVEKEELFKFRRSRAHQIVKHTTEEMNHYFREMGLKLYARILDRNLKDLMDFSGHAQVGTLMGYLAEGQLKKKILEWE